MLRRTVIGCALGLLAAFAVIPAAAAAPSIAPSATTTPLAVVQIATRPTPINSDGSVEVVMWVRCQTGINAFEFDTNVTQRDTFGFSSLIGPFLLPCDGTRHRTVVNVFPADGQRNFHPGVAHISVFLGLFDGTTGRDSEARDSVGVRLYQR